MCIYIMYIYILCIYILCIYILCIYILCVYIYLYYMCMYIELPCKTPPFSLWKGSKESLKPRRRFQDCGLHRHQVSWLLDFKAEKDVGFWTLKISKSGETNISDFNGFKTLKLHCLCFFWSKNGLNNSLTKSLVSFTPKRNFHWHVWDGNNQKKLGFDAFIF